MSRITGWEEMHHIPPKVLLMYTAVLQLLEEGADVASIRVSTITQKAGIGKGTAYEYFDTKEEIVACAILFLMQRAMESLEIELAKKEGFRKKLDFFLDEMEKQDDRQICFMRFVHLMTDTSELSKMLQEKMDAEDFAPYRPISILRKMVTEAVERKELRNDLPMDYMVYSVFSRIMSYMMTLTMGKDFINPAESIRPSIYEGMIRDFGVK